MLQHANDDDNLTISSNADFSNDITDREWISSSVITLNHTPIAWFSRKERAIAMSTAESEYRTIATALQVGIHIQRLAQSLQMLPNKIDIKGLSDNKPALDMLHYLGGLKLSKFIDIRHHYIQSKIKKRMITRNHVPTGRMKADIMKKPFPKHRFTTNRDALFVVNCPNMAIRGPVRLKQ